MSEAKSDGRPIRIMFQDEARFGRISDPRRCWARRPIRPEVKAQIVREYVYVFGAVSPEDGRHDSLVLPRADTVSMSIFLTEIGRRYPGEHIVMFMDQAGWHKSIGLKIPDNIELAFLPAYSPDLNPQEQVWDELREKYFANKLFGSLKAVMDNAVKGLRYIERSQQLVKNLTLRNWMLNPY